MRSRNGGCAATGSGLAHPGNDPLDCTHLELSFLAPADMFVSRAPAVLHTDAVAEVRRDRYRVDAQKPVT